MGRGVNLIGLQESQVHFKLFIAIAANEGNQLWQSFVRGVLEDGGIACHAFFEGSLVDDGIGICWVVVLDLIQYAIVAIGAIVDEGIVGGVGIEGGIGRVLGIIGTHWDVYGVMVGGGLGMAGLEMRRLSWTWVRL